MNRSASFASRSTQRCPRGTPELHADVASRWACALAWVGRVRVALRGVSDVASLARTVPLLAAAREGSDDASKHAMALDGVSQGLAKLVVDAVLAEHEPPSAARRASRRRELKRRDRAGCGDFGRCAQRRATVKRSEVMTYRDEQEALRAENQSLRAELEQLKHHAPPTPPPAAKTSATLGLVIGVAMVGITVVTVALVTLITRPVRSPRTYTPRAAHWVGVSWGARVTTASGVELAPDTACSIHAAVDSSGASGEAPTEVRVVCADRELYWLGSARAAGGSMMTSGQCRRMQLRSDDHAAFSCEFEERGAELRAYPRVAIDTANRTAVVAREGASPMRVVLAVDALSQFAPIR